MKFTDSFKSTEGLEEFERDDVENIVNSLAQTVQQMEMKKAKGRNVKAEEKAVDKAIQDGIRLMIEWAQRPRPSTSTPPLKLDDNTRLLVRKTMMVSDIRDSATLESEAFCKELLQSVLDIGIALEVEMGSLYLDPDTMSTTGSLDSEHDPFNRTAYKPIDYSVQDLVDWNEPAEEMIEEMMEEKIDADADSTAGDLEEDEDDLEELEWPYAKKDV